MKKQGPNRISMSFRFTLEVKRLLDLLSEKLGVSMVAIMELAIREFAAKHGVSQGAASAAFGQFTCQLKQAVPLGKRLWKQTKTKGIQFYGFTTTLD